MQTVMKVEDIVKEVILNLSSVYINKLKEYSQGNFITPEEALEIYTEALHDTAKAYASEANSHDQKLH